MLWLVMQLRIMGTNLTSNLERVRQMNLTGFRKFRDNHRRFAPDVGVSKRTQ
jgi:hypothetical protein